jgi:ABC-2 type transport system permease protein
MAGLSGDVEVDAPEDPQPGHLSLELVRSDELQGSPVSTTTRSSSRGPKTTRVVAAQVHLWPKVKELWRARELFTFLVRKEIKVKYKNSFLGFLWSMLNPALTLAVFWVLFTFFLPNGIPNFVVYMFSAILVWNLFQTAVMAATGVVVGNSGIVKKVAFPREILALSSVGTSFMFFLFQSIVLVAFMIAFWHAPQWENLWILLPALLAVVTFAAALSVFFSAVNVYFRDIQHLVEVALMAWFWAIPGIYAFYSVHDKLERHRILGIPGTHLIWLYFLNPMVPAVMTFQRIFYNNDHPVSTVTHQVQPVLATYPTSWYVASNMVVFAVSIVLLFGAMKVFGRIEGNFAEEL